MSADEIVKALRCGNGIGGWCYADCGFRENDHCELSERAVRNGAADLIESMQSQLADYHHMSELVDGKMEENQRLRRINENLQSKLTASQRREQAAVKDFEECMKNKKERCAYCMHDDGREPGESLCCANVCGFEWRGPQEAGKGDSSCIKHRES